MNKLVEYIDKFLAISIITSFIIFLLSLSVLTSVYGISGIRDMIQRKKENITQEKRDYIKREIKIAIKHLSDKYYFCEEWHRNHDDSLVSVVKSIDDYKPCMTNMFGKGE